jgi:exoribonuclease R
MGLKDRNRAFQGDVVVVELNHRDHWIVRDSHAKTITPNLMQLNLTGGASGSQRQHKYCFIADLSDKNLKIPANRVQKTAKVVHITEAKGSRIAVGLLKVSLHVYH